MLENNIFKLNHFQKRINRFKNATFVSEEYDSFNFNNNLKSDHFEELEFTNYVSSDMCNKYLDLLHICQNITQNINSWDRMFVADELEITPNTPKLKRLNDIINKVNNKIINPNELILKFKNLNDKGIQFYIKNENKILTLYLIDLYHLGIEATDQKSGRTDRKGIYRARKKCSYDIKNIVDKLNIQK